MIPTDREVLVSSLVMYSNSRVQIMAHDTKHILVAPAGGVSPFYLFSVGKIG